MAQIEKNITCGRCNGLGILKHYMHIDKGVCFTCKGEGKVAKLPKSKIKLPPLADEYIQTAEIVRAMLKTQKIVMFGKVGYSKGNTGDHSFVFTTWECDNQIGESSSYGGLFLGLCYHIQQNNFKL